MHSVHVKGKVNDVHTAYPEKEGGRERKGERDRKRAGKEVEAGGREVEKKRDGGRRREREGGGGRGRDRAPPWSHSSNVGYKLTAPQTISETLSQGTVVACIKGLHRVFPYSTILKIFTFIFNIC